MKSWDELLWLHLTGALEGQDRAEFEYLLDTNPAYREELAEWTRLEDGTRAEVSDRVEQLPPLPSSFFDRLEMIAAQDGRKRVTTSINGSHRNVPYQKVQDKMTVIPLEKPRERHKLNISYTLIAAVAAAALFGVLLFYGREVDQGPPPESANPPPAGLSDDESLLALTTTPTPAPSLTPSGTLVGPTVTLRPSVTFTSTPFWDVQVTATPIPAQGGRTNDPRASITPSVIEPIIAPPATLVGRVRLPGGDFSPQIAWSPYGNIAVAAYSGAWLYNSDALNLSVRLLPDEGPGLVSVAYSPNGQRIATLNWDQKLTLWDVETGLRLGQLEDLDVWDTLMFADNRNIVFNRSFGAVEIQNSLSSTSLGVADTEYISREAGIATVVPGTGRVVTVNAAGEIKLVTVVSGNIASEFTVAISGQPLRSAVNAAGTRFAVASSNGVVQVIDLETQTEVARTTLDGIPGALSFDSDGALAVSSRTATLSSVWLWDYEADAKNAILVFDLPINDIAFEPDGDQIAVMTGDGLLLLLEIEQ